MTSEKNCASIKGKILAEENRFLLDELLLRQDTMELVRNREYEKRFLMMVNILKDEIKQGIADVSAVAKNTTTSVDQKGNGNTYKINNSKVKVQNRHNLMPILKKKSV